MAIPWRLAKSLIQLNGQVRDVLGQVRIDTIGDAAHASRTSDHNPWIDDSQDYRNVVSACDYFLPGNREQEFVDDLIASRDSRIKYIIHNSRIWRSYNKTRNGRVVVKAWEPERYYGPNSHFNHVHLSVNSGKLHYDNTSRWIIFIQSPANRIPDVEEEVIKRGDKGNTVALLQTRLNNFPGKTKTLKVDEDFGPATESQVINYQKQAQVPRHKPGVVDAITWGNLAKYDRK